MRIDRTRRAFEVDQRGMYVDVTHYHRVVLTSLYIVDNNTHRSPHAGRQAQMIDRPTVGHNRKA